MACCSCLSSIAVTQPQYVTVDGSRWHGQCGKIRWLRHRWSVESCFNGVDMMDICGGLKQQHPTKILAMKFILTSELYIGECTVLKGIFSTSCFTFYFAFASCPGFTASHIGNVGLQTTLPVVCADTADDCLLSVECRIDAWQTTQTSRRFRDTELSSN